MYVNVLQRGNKIYEIYYTEDGTKRLKKVDYKPSLQIPTVDDGDFKGLYGENLKNILFEDIRSYNDYIRQTQNSIPIHGNIQPIYQYIAENYKRNDFNLNYIKTLYFDIEVNSEEGFPHPYIAAWPITSITVKDTSANTFYIAATKKYNKKLNRFGLDPSKIYFKLCKDDSEILIWLTKLMRMLKPDILCGFYSDNFDIPYIINRFDYLFSDENIKNKLSPFNNGVYTEQINEKDFRNAIPGVTLYDYKRLYKKYVFTPRERYSLDYLSEVELGENKIDYSEYDGLSQLWANDPQKYIDYNIHDVELIHLLDQKLGLINLACSVAYKANCNFIDIMGTIKPWECISYNYLRNKGVAIPPKKDNDVIKYPGGYVKEPIPGIYDWVVSFDLNSLYPHIQQQWNISPECLITDVERVDVNLFEISDRFLNKSIDVHNNYTLAGNGHYFSKEKIGFIPTILREYYDERKQVKKKMLEYKQELVYVNEELKKRGL